MLARTISGLQPIAPLLARSMPSAVHGARRPHGIAKDVVQGVHRTLVDTADNPVRRIGAFVQMRARAERLRPGANAGGHRGYTPSLIPPFPNRTVAAASRKPKDPRQPAAPRRDPVLPALLGELAGGQAHSGSALAARLGVTRAAVWKQIEQLRELGLGISGQAGSGYQLDAPIDFLDAGTIGDLLEVDARARVGEISVHWQLDSTNSELLRRVGSATHDSTIACLAEIQSQGRGRRGRAWQMPLAGGIALSLLRRFEGPMASLAGLSLVVGIAAAQALEDSGIRDVGLKWPNDLVARGAKLAGVLVELGGDALGPCHAVIGIGINCRLGARAAAAIDQPWIDLATLANGAAPSRNEIVARVLTRLVAALERFADEGFAAFGDDYARRDVLCGQRVSVLRADGRSEGTARGVNARGAMRVAFAEGERAVDSGEVSIRVAP
jgi:BirA family biotin operon repressor/biotin-[acetyl-CoA-carboxylase] ligase